MKTCYSLLFTLLTTCHLFSQGLPLPYSTGFDNATQQSGWEQFRTGYAANYDWSIGAGGNSAPNCLSHDYNVGGSEEQIVIDWFVSPALDLSAASELTFKAKSSGFSTPTIDNCEVYYGIGSQNPEDGFFTLLTNMSVVTPQFSWIDFSADMPAIGDEVYIAFKYKTIGAAWMTYSIDDIQVNAVTAVAPNTTSDLANEITVYPNPAKSTVHISFPNYVESDWLTIHDICGNQISYFPVKNSSQMDIDLSGLENGIYFISYHIGEKKTASRKLVVAN